MSSEKDDLDEVDLAQAYRELAKGEQTAAQMEASLTTLEGKLEAMLAAMEGKNGVEGKDEGEVKEGEDGGKK